MTEPQEARADAATTRHVAALQSSSLSLLIGIRLRTRYRVSRPQFPRRCATCKTSRRRASSQRIAAERAPSNYKVHILTNPSRDRNPKTPSRTGGTRPDEAKKGTTSAHLPCEAGLGYLVRQLPVWGQNQSCRLGTPAHSTSEPATGLRDPRRLRVACYLLRRNVPKGNRLLVKSYHHVFAKIQLGHQAP